MSCFYTQKFRLDDVLEITNSLDIEDFLITVDIKKEFDSINHSFLSCILKQFGYGSEFIKWMKILIKTQNRIINDGKATLYFKTERETRQGDPLSAYFFILALEVVFTFIYANHNIESLQFIAITNFAYADDTNFVLKAIIST